MALKDRLSSALGGVIGYGVDVFSDALKKANPDTHEESKTDADTASMAMVVAGQRPEALPPQPTQDNPRGLLYDPFALIDQLGYRDRPSGLTYATLRETAKRVPTYLAIEQTRITQVSSFATPQVDKRDPGFEIKLRDEKATPSKEDTRRMTQLTDWMLQTGSTWGPGRDDFKTYLRKLTRDSLELDQACTEVVRNRKGIPAEFYCLDGATIRLADVPPGAETSSEPDTVKYVQVYDEIIIAEFSPQDLVFGVRNPRSDIRVNGYGYSEIEMLISVVTASLWAYEYNRKFFSQGTSAKGILNMKGSVPDAKMDSFRRQWQMMLSGVANAFRTPFTNVDDLQWINLSQNNRDMEYSAWMDWLIKVTCAVMQFDPAEINFAYGNAGQTSQMFATPVDQKLKQSKDRGLRPLLDDFAQWINVNLIWRLDPRYKLVFVGLDAKSADQAVDLGKKKVTFIQTVDELRAEDDLPPLPDGKGECLLDPTWLQFAAAKDQANQPQQGPMGEPPPQPGQEPMPQPGEGEPPPGAPQPEGGDQGGDQDTMGAVFGQPEEPEEKSMARFQRARRELEAGRISELKKAQPTVTRTVVRYEVDL